MEYLILKWLHILSATLLFGTGIGSAFYKFMTDRTGNIEAISQTNKLVVLADWLITSPTIILQPITGICLAFIVGYPMTSSWLVMSIVFYIIAGLCWLPVVHIQIRMRNLSLTALKKHQPLDNRYTRLSHIWFWLGIPAFTALVGVYYLMVFKPMLWH